MARFISVCRANITDNSNANLQQAIITGSTNSSGIPASTYGVVLSILASNTHASTQNVTVTLFKGGVDLSQGGLPTSLVTSGVVPAQSSVEFMSGNKLIIEPDDVIKAYGSTSAVIDITVSYMLNNQDTTIT